MLTSVSQRSHVEEPTIPGRCSGLPSQVTAQVLALQAGAGNAAVAGWLGPRLQRMRVHALRFSKANNLALGYPTYKDVKSYVEDRDNPETLRLGLLRAWNQDRDVTHPKYIDPDAPEVDAMAVDKPAGVHTNPYHHSIFKEYRDFTKTTTNVEIEIFGGLIRADYNRGAPKISSSKRNWGGAVVGDSYRAYVEGLRSGGRSDSEMARRLLALEVDVLTPRERHAAAKMTITVYLAEEWRKQGAAKIYRGVLRLIANGDLAFEDFPEYFEFALTADAGRRQVARHHDIMMGAVELSSVSTQDLMVASELSVIEEHDLSSDEEMQTEDKKTLTTVRRRFALTPHQ
jgi:hypothetical protein